MKLKKLFLISILCTLFCSTMCLFTACDNNEEVVNDLTFTEKGDGTYSVKASSTSISGELIIPSTYNGKSVTEIVRSGFKGCTSLTSVTMPDSITTTGGGAFYNCSALRTVTLSKNLTKLTTLNGDGMFGRCTSLTSIIIPEGVTTIPSYAFQGCTSLTSVTIPDNVATISDSAFSQCSLLASIEIPISVTKISSFAFNGCTSLKTIVYPGTQSQWDAVMLGTSAIPSSTTIVCGTN